MKRYAIHPERDGYGAHYQVVDRLFGSVVAIVPGQTEESKDYATIVAYGLNRTTGYGEA